MQILHRVLNMYSAVATGGPEGPGPHNNFRDFLSLFKQMV